jgi:hypothetical protein
MVRANSKRQLPPLNSLSAAATTEVCLMSQNKRNDGGQLVIGQIAWLSFPALGQLFESDPASAIDLLEQKLQKLHSDMETRTPADRARARLAAPGYRHALALLQEMRQFRNAPENQQVPERGRR